MKTKYLYFLIVSLLVFSSCKKFLDVQPESDVTKEQLFSTEEGFKEALNGVYTFCAGGELYGGKLTFSNLEIMAQNFDLTNAYFQRLQAFKYGDKDVITSNDQIWANAYKAIGYCNAILEVIDEKKGIFHDRNYQLIKGETLVLRAYLHFDLLRMFAPSYKNNPSTSAIPYVTVVSIKNTAFSSTTEVLAKLTADLEEAKSLLKNADPILSAGYVVGYADKTYAGTVAEKDKATETASGDLFLQNRRHRMNYYTACGELARVYLYKEDYVKALENANEVINSKKFPWTLKEDFFKTDIGQRDKIFYPELISAWYVKDSENMLKGFYSNNDASLSPTIAQKDLIYEKGSVGADDWRWLQWFRDEPSTNSTSRSFLQKYIVNGTPVRNMHPLVAPAIRLTEMYYIAAEASFDSDKPKALELFNTVRNHRGIGEALSASIDKTEFLRKLVTECRKEFYGESQIFFMNKRLNKEITNTNGLVYPATNAIFVFPIPLDEVSYRN
jgi:hypothetical protein